MKVQTEHEMLAESLGALREALVACRETASEGGNTADSLSAAMTAHLAELKAGDLPLAAQMIWIEKVARPLKADASKALPSRAFAALRSWPAARIARLVKVMAAIEAIVVDAENDAQHEVIYAEISRTYS